MTSVKFSSKKLLGFLLIALLAFSLAGCVEISVEGEGDSETEPSSATIADLVMASEVDEDSYKVITQTDVFQVDSPVINVVGTLKGGKKNKTVVKAAWYYIDEDIFIGEAEVTAGYDEGPVWFDLSKPDNDWPVGDYIVKMYVDGEEVSVKTFSVE